jgi:hypothetical protein
MSDNPTGRGGVYRQGGDATAISEIARDQFGNFTVMFEYHGWPERGQEMMRKVQTRVVETYGSVRAFEEYFRRIDQSRRDSADFWTDDTSVLFTSFWGWTPDTWGTVGWSGDRGFTRRANLLTELSDPFICVCYVTSNRSEIDPDLKGMMAGFYLVSHEMGDRNEFTHPIHHNREPTKWRHSLRAIRSFSYLPEYRPRAMDVFPELSGTARHVSAMGEVITDRGKISELRGIPWIEVPVYSSQSNEIAPEMQELSSGGMVQAGPASGSGYTVPEGTLNLPRELYVLRLEGDTDTYVGYPTGGRSIYKIGLSVSPDLRRQTLQKSLPRGTFRWRLHRTTRRDGHTAYSGFSAAVAGEYAMKHHLAKSADHLDGEFYLATEDEIDAAWEAGRMAALEFHAV